MGIDTQAVLVVGLPEDQLGIQRGDDGNWDEDEILNMVPSYFDADEGVVGIEVFKTGNYNYLEVDLEELIPKIEAAKATFESLTGKEGKLYLSPKVW